MIDIKQKVDAWWYETQGEKLDYDAINKRVNVLANERINIETVAEMYHEMKTPRVKKMITELMADRKKEMKDMKQSNDTVKLPFPWS